MSFESLSTEELVAERSQLDAALRMAVSHGAELPEEAKSRLRQMNDELERRQSENPTTRGPGGADLSQRP